MRVKRDRCPRLHGGFAEGVMPRLFRSVLVGFGVAMACGAVTAKASVDVAEGSVQSRSTSGYDSFVNGFFFGPGTYDIPYSVTVKDEGLRTTRDWGGFCTGMGHFGYCQPPSNGFEVAVYGIEVGVVTYIPEIDLFIEGDPMLLVLVSTKADGLADSVTEYGNASFTLEPNQTASLVEFVVVDSSPLSPVPEPAPNVLLLVGLAGLGVAARRRCSQGAGSRGRVGSL
jgi:PEP-CTERM motif